MPSLPIPVLSLAKTKMRLLALVLFAVASCCATDEWGLFKAHHQKHYPSAEHDNHRRSIFLENLKEIRRHNLEADLQLHSWHMGVNVFSDMTDDEIRKTMTGYREPRLSQAKNLKLKDLEGFQAAAKVNWIKKGYVNRVVSQGRCGSCYTFSATVALEGQYKNLTGKLVKFSEQNLVDCSYRKRYSYYYNPNNGCAGGWMKNCFSYAGKTKGLMLDKDYRYRSKRGRCHVNRRKLVRFNVKKNYAVGKSETALKVAVAKYGPISVAISTRGRGFMKYKRGVYYERRCPTRLDHAVAVVGYGRENGQDYWLVRNSWSNMWGDKGYIKMARNKRNMCGIANEATFPVLSR